MFHPWYFEIPLAFKPTYLNVEVNLEEITLNNLLVGSQWNLNALNRIFGNDLNMDFLSLSQVEYEIVNI